MMTTADSTIPRYNCNKSFSIKHFLNNQTKNTQDMLIKMKEIIIKWDF